MTGVVSIVSVKEDSSFRPGLRDCIRNEESLTASLLKYFPPERYTTCCQPV
jgi:hypothetical protein